LNGIKGWWKGGTGGKARREKGHHRPNAEIAVKSKVGEWDWKSK